MAIFMIAGAVSDPATLLPSLLPMTATRNVGFCSVGTVLWCRFGFSPCSAAVRGGPRCQWAPITS